MSVQWLWETESDADEEEATGLLVCSRLNCVQVRVRPHQQRERSSIPVGPKVMSKN